MTRKATYKLWSVTIGTKKIKVRARWYGNAVRAAARLLRVTLRPGDDGDWKDVSAEVINQGVTW